MLTLRINWNIPLSINETGYSVYTAERYHVSVRTRDKNSRHSDECNVWKTAQQCDGPDLSRSCDCEGTTLYLDGDKHMISLSKGSRVYVMNAHGSTVDTIFG